jgi:hypothetical protein
LASRILLAMSSLYCDPKSKMTIISCTFQVVALFDKSFLL